MNVSLSSGGARPLVKAVVTPYLRENLTVRATLVRTADGLISTGARLRSTHLISMDSTNAHDFRAAVKDHNGVWSELSDTATLAAGNFVGGSRVGSIGSGVNADMYIDEPAVNFPDLSLGSGTMAITRTLVGGTWFDEVRRSKWVAARAGFKVVLKELDLAQVELLHGFYKALNGPAKPFFFDYPDPITHRATRYVTRFRDPRMADELFDVTYSNMDFQLVEVMGQSFGGNV